MWPQEDITQRRSHCFPEGRVLSSSGHRAALRHRSGRLLPRRGRIHLEPSAQTEQLTDHSRPIMPCTSPFPALSHSSSLSKDQSVTPSSLTDLNSVLSCRVFWPECGGFHTEHKVRLCLPSCLFLSRPVSRWDKTISFYERLIWEVVAAYLETFKA